MTSTLPNFDWPSSQYESSTLSHSWLGERLLVNIVRAFNALVGSRLFPYLFPLFLIKFHKTPYSRRGVRNTKWMDVHILIRVLIADQMAHDFLSH
jgi:hypothetical protein